MSSNLDWLQRFYLSLCNDDWEHQYGCDIGNVDNPGWTFKFDLTDTVYEQIDGPNVPVGMGTADGDRNWLILRKVGPVIDGACGPLRLDELIGHFRAWVASVEPAAMTSEKQWQQ